MGRKPNSVRLRSRPFGRELRRDDHSSSPAIADGIEQPTRKLRTGRPSMLPYLALLRAGFCLPPVLPRARCALTAPFHPYLLRSPNLRGALRRASLAACPTKRVARSRAVYFLCHFPSGYPDRALPGALPCGVRTFLLASSRLAQGRPADSKSDSRAAVSEPGGASRTAIICPTAAVRASLNC